jgi:hypothetical protein
MRAHKVSLRAQHHRLLTTRQGGLHRRGTAYGDPALDDLEARSTAADPSLASAAAAY